MIAGSAPGVTLTERSMATVLATTAEALPAGSRARTFTVCEPLAIADSDSDEPVAACWTSSTHQV